MPEAVALTDAYQRVLGTYDRQLLGRYRACAAVVPDLEHVHVAKHPAGHQGLEHLGLSVARQKCSETPFSRTENHACLVGRRVLDRRCRPEHIEREATYRDALPSTNFLHPLRTHE